MPGGACPRIVYLSRGGAVMPRGAVAAGAFASTMIKIEDWYISIDCIVAIHAAPDGGSTIYVDGIGPASPIRTAIEPEALIAALDELTSDGEDVADNTADN